MTNMSRPLIVLNVDASAEPNTGMEVVDDLVPGDGDGELGLGVNLASLPANVTDEYVTGHSQDVAWSFILVMTVLAVLLAVTHEQIRHALMVLAALEFVISATTAFQMLELSLHGLCVKAFIGVLYVSDPALHLLQLPGQTLEPERLRIDPTGRLGMTIGSQRPTTASSSVAMLLAAA